ncbi:MAG: SDR family NAD(P)-dependent oxidoreductase [Chloroflexota bacterium]
MTSHKRVALVTGTSRGIGKAIALELGLAGFSVYLTGRTRRGAESYSKLSGSIDETADQIITSGGRAIAVQCDHRDDTAVTALFQQILDEAGRLDLLVNNAWSGYSTMQRKLEEALTEPKSREQMNTEMDEAFGEFTEPFWSMPTTNWDEMSTVGVRSHYVTAVLAARIMVEQNEGLILNTTADISHTGGQVAYNMAKCAINRMTADMAAQLQPHSVGVVAIQPGMVLTEMFEERFRKGILDESDFARFEAPSFVGKCVVALATAPDILQHSGDVLSTVDIAKAYGIPLLDGRHVPLI